MILTVPDEIAESARLLAKNEGITPEILLVRALHAYFPTVTPELQEEFNAWEQASDDDFNHTERSQQTLQEPYAAR